MTVPARDTPAIVVYTQGTIAIDDSFNIIFPFLANDEYIKVTLRLNDETTQDLVLDEDFSVVTSDGTNSVYGICVFLKEFADIKRICIERDIAPDQDVSFTSQTVFTETTETALDKVTMLTQDYRIKEYALRAPDDEVVFDGTMQLPPSNVRANKYLYFDTFGLPTAGMGPDQSKALRQGQGEEADPSFEVGFIERRNKGIIFDSDASVVLTEREKILNEHLQGGAGISVTTLEGALTTSISAVAGNNVIVNGSGISVPIAQNTSLGVVMAGRNISIGAGGEINAANTEYSAGNGIAVSEAGVISAVAGDNVTVDEDGIAVAIGTTTSLGVLQVGTNLAVTDGVISAPASTGSALGVVKAGTNTSIGAGGEINAVDTTYAAGNGLQLSTGMFSVRAHSNVVVDANGVSVPVATSSSLGVMQVGTGLSVTDGVVSASATGSIIYPFTLDKDDWTLMPDKITLSNTKMPWINGLIQIGKDSIAVGAYGCIAVKTGAVWDKLPAIVPTDLKSIAYGKDIIVVVGSNGVILSGTDIRSLSRVTSKTTTNLNGVCWTGTKFVVVGEGGFLANSPDGEIWTIRPSGTSETLYRVAQTSLGTVAVGSGGYVGLSTNHGDTLTAKTSGTSASLFGVCQGASDIIIVGANGTILTTGNLTTFFTKGSGTSNALWDVHYADSKLAVVGVGAVLLYSSNQDTWTLESYVGSIAFYAVMYAENRWICAGSQDIRSTSSLGVSLTAEEPISSADIFDSAYGNGIYVSLLGTGKLLITTNKRNYAVVQTLASHSLASIAFGNGVFVIGLHNGHYGGLLVGADVMNLTSVSSGLGTESLYGCAYCSKTSNFILVTSAGKCITSATPAVSASWVATTISSGVGLTGVSVDDNGFCVAVGGGGKVFTNTDILNQSTWVERSTGTTMAISDVAVGKNTIVAIGGSGLILTASKADPSVWTIRSSSGPNLNSIKYLNGMFVAVGDSGTVKVSNEDVSTWIIPAAHTSYNLTGIILKDNYIFLQGAYGTTLEGFTFAKQEISLPGVTSSDVGIADVILTDNLTTAELEKTEWNKVDMIDTYTDKITVTCLEEIPTINLSCQLKV